MRLFGFEISVARKAYYPRSSTLVGDRGTWWWPIVREPFTGAWQRNMERTTESIFAHHAVYACIERIASDIAKCRLRLVEQDSNGIWQEIEASAFSPSLRKPNHYQTRIQFIENWIISKLTAGNTYVLKQRDNRNVVTAMYVLDPLGVRVLVTPEGDIYYELNPDNLSGLELADFVQRPVVPASEIIHDMMTIKYHPLCGVPPLVAAGPAASQGLNIQNTSSSFFKNNSTPGGVLSAPGEIKEATAKRLKEYWQTEFTGNNSGKIAVLGDGLKFEPMAQTAQASQLVEQLGLTARMVCSAFGVPAYMVGVDDPPSYNNIESLNRQYYQQTLQKFFEHIELLLDEGLGLTEIIGKTYGTEFDLDDLLRMDTKTLIDAEAAAVKAGVKAPNEARLRLNLGPVDGGKTPYLQQQNYSLAALEKRDAKEDPFAKAPPAGGGFLKTIDGDDYPVELPPVIVNMLGGSSVPQLPPPDTKSEIEMAQHMLRAKIDKQLAA